METATKAFLADSIATLLINGSFSIQKLGHRAIERDEEHVGRGHLSSKVWWAGFLIMVVGVIIHVIALPYADMTLIAANSSLAVVCNLMLSIYLFEEKWVWRYDLPAVILIIGGSFSLAGIANKEQPEYDQEEMIKIIWNWPSIVFYVYLVVFVVTVHCMMYKFEKGLREFESDALEID